MDSDNEMIVQQRMQEEAEAVAERKKHLLLLVSLLLLLAKLLSPRIGGLLKEKRKNIDWHQMVRFELVEDDYFKNDATHGPKTFRYHFQMNNGTFQNIVQGVHAYDSCFLLKKIGLDYMVSLLISTAMHGFFEVS
jgi:hypothetical protein